MSLKFLYKLSSTRDWYFLTSSFFLLDQRFKHDLLKFTWEHICNINIAISVLKLVKVTIEITYWGANTVNRDTRISVAASWRETDNFSSIVIFPLSSALIDTLSFYIKKLTWSYVVALKYWSLLIFLFPLLSCIWWLYLSVNFAYCSGTSHVYLS